MISPTGTPQVLPRAQLTLNLDDEDEEEDELEAVEHELGIEGSGHKTDTHDPSVLLMSGSGIPVKLLSKYGATLYSTLLVASSAGQGLQIFWRQRPEPLGCDLSFLREVTKSFSCSHRLVLTFSAPHLGGASGAGGGRQDSFELQLELEDREDELGSRSWTGAEQADALQARLDALMQLHSRQQQQRQQEQQQDNAPLRSRSGSAGGGGSDGGSPPQFQHQQSSPPSSHSKASSLLTTLDNENFKAVIKTEYCYQLATILRWKESALLVERQGLRKAQQQLGAAFSTWSRYIHELNRGKMDEDSKRWRLHATTNLDTDLQAWYHAVFSREVYRLRGPFWYRDAVLPQYRHSTDLIDQALTPLEEAALAHVLGSPDTTYGDVAGQMMVVQALVTAELYSLFQELSARGAQIIKCPRTGRPAKKIFRFSFVEGNIYLTWRGKFGNQGVDLGEVSSVVPGITTDVLRRTANAGKEGCYLSLNADARSVDLCFEDADTRNDWLHLLSALVDKEKGSLAGIEAATALGEDAPDEDFILMYSALGKEAVPAKKLRSLLSALRPR